MPASASPPESTGDTAPRVSCTALGTLGRLGNQLFQVAATIGIARANGCRYQIAPWPYAPGFAGPFAIEPAGPAATGAVYREPSFEYRPVQVDGPTELLGFFQSEKYFAHCAEEIRRLFAPNAGIAAGIERARSTLPAGRLCSVHVRRTDYLAHSTFNQLAAGDYYERAMASFGPETTFVFFSDDVDWCRMHFPGDRSVFIRGGNEFGDFFLMSRCDDHIVANSSFSWWSAWLDARPGKRVIAPGRWFAGEFADPAAPFVAGPPHRGFHDARDLVPETWERM